MPNTPDRSSTYPLADLLEAAGVVIKQLVQKDATRVPPLETALVPPASPSPFRHPICNIPVLTRCLQAVTRRMAIPEALFEQITGLPATCSMGLFPQVDWA